MSSQSSQVFLIDRQIEQFVNQGVLIVNNTFSPAQLSGSAYDLRAGRELISRNDISRVDISERSYDIQPGEVVTISSFEQLDFRKKLFGALIVTNHTQLSRGLEHATTSVDPGFAGPLAITLINSGSTPYPLKFLDRIGKMMIWEVTMKPARVYGTTKAPRVPEGSLDHATAGLGDRAAFVIMSFSNTPLLIDAYKLAIKPAITAAGYRCVRVDEVESNRRITDAVLTRIRLASFLVADLTEQRPNCYYELGFAHALGKEVILTCHKDTPLHFDVKDYPTIIWESASELKLRVAARIRGTVGRDDRSRPARIRSRAK